MNKLALKSCFIGMTLAMLAGQTVTLAASRPNIVVIFTDDQGYGDVSALNPAAKFQTPNMDRLAKEGIAFTAGHSADSVCTPSRYGLLTGRYPWRTRRKKGVMQADEKCLIVNGRMTLASLLRKQGYNTGMVGKWHLGMEFPGTEGNRDWSRPITDMPLDKGFDYFFGIPASMNFGLLAWFEGRYAKVPPTLYTQKKKNSRSSDFRFMPPYKTSPKGLKGAVEVAPDFIDNQCLTRLTDKAIEWMSAQAADAKKGKPFFLYLPFTASHYPICPLPEFQGQGHAGAYGEFVIETDYHIGQVLKFLKTSGLDENTLIVFTSDNGPEKSWAQRIKEFDHDSRGELRGGKRSVYEGGQRVPFLVRWPKGIKQPGRVWDKPVSQTDILATVAELTGAKLPDNAGEDSQSFAQVLLDPKADYNRVPFISHDSKDSRYGITEGSWKLILPTAKKPAELYDLSTDRAETTNVATDHPEKEQSLTRKTTALIVSGRSTPGTPEPNDTGYWKDLTWMTPADFEK